MIIASKSVLTKISNKFISDYNELTHCVWQKTAKEMYTDAPKIFVVFFMMILLLLLPMPISERITLQFWFLVLLLLVLWFVNIIFFVWFCGFFSIQVPFNSLTLPLILLSCWFLVFCCYAALRDSSPIILKELKISLGFSLLSDNLTLFALGKLYQRGGIFIMLGKRGGIFITRISLINCLIFVVVLICLVFFTIIIKQNIFVMSYFIGTLSTLLALCNWFIPNLLLVWKITN